MKQGRDRPAAVKRRPLRVNRLVGRKMKMTSLMNIMIPKMFQKGAQILPCPEYRKMEKTKKTLALEEGNITFDLTLPPTLLMNTDTSQICKLKSRKSLELNWTPILLGLLRL